MNKPAQPTTAEMREWFERGFTNDPHTAWYNCSILLDRLEAADNEASTLALSLWKRHYKKDSPVFELCDSVAGIISQIDNMSAGISNSLEAANAEIRESQEALDEQAKELEMANRVVAEAGRKEYKYQTKLETLEYRHECLKQIHKDSTGILRTSRVDEIIDEYIKWEEDDD